MRLVTVLLYFVIACFGQTVESHTTRSRGAARNPPQNFLSRLRAFLRLGPTHNDHSEVEVEMADFAAYGIHSEVFAKNGWPNESGSVSDRSSPLVEDIRNPIANRPGTAAATRNPDEQDPSDTVVPPIHSSVNDSRPDVDLRNSGTDELRGNSGASSGASSVSSDNMELAVDSQVNRIDAVLGSQADISVVQELLSNIAEVVRVENNPRPSSPNSQLEVSIEEHDEEFSEDEQSVSDSRPASPTDELRDAGSDAGRSSVDEDAEERDDESVISHLESGSDSDESEIDDENASPIIGLPSDPPGSGSHLAQEVPNTSHVASAVTDHQNNIHSAGASDSAQQIPTPVTGTVINADLDSNANRSQLRGPSATQSDLGENVDPLGSQKDSSGWGKYWGYAAAGAVVALGFAWALYKYRS